MKTNWIFFSIFAINSFLCLILFLVLSGNPLVAFMGIVSSALAINAALSRGV